MSYRVGEPWKEPTTKVAELSCSWEPRECKILVGEHWYEEGTLVGEHWHGSH